MLLCLPAHQIARLHANPFAYFPKMAQECLDPAALRRRIPATSGAQTETSIVLTVGPPDFVHLGPCSLVVLKCFAHVTHCPATMGIFFKAI